MNQKEIKNAEMIRARFEKKARRRRLIAAAAPRPDGAYHGFTWIYRQGSAILHAIAYASGQYASACGGKRVRCQHTSASAPTAGPM